MTAAIVYEPEAFTIETGRVLGRRAAGEGFLRAAAQANRGKSLVAYAAREEAAAAFRRQLALLAPETKGMWLPANRLELLRDFGVLHHPDPLIAGHARARLRVGVANHAISGVTHTLCSQRTLEGLAALTVAPVMPWDAVICTSNVAQEVVAGVFDAQDEYLAWRIGGRRPARPMLPVIPLGIHTADFSLSPGERTAGRSAMGISEDEVTVLFAGRLSFNGKAHPHPMYLALEKAAQTTGQNLVLLHAGQFASPEVEVDFRTLAAEVCPSVRCLFPDVREQAAYRSAWAAADLFVSLADSLQETFGLTPVEAMAAGLPVVVTDWNGYRDTVRDGVDGFRISTWQPGPGLGEAIARDHETAVTDYDVFLARAGGAVALDLSALVERLAHLVANEDLRKAMGDAGRRRAREQFDWRHVYAQYEALWAEQDAVRRRDGPALQTADAPPQSPAGRDPFSAFAGYPSKHIRPDTLASLAPDAAPEAYAALAQNRLIGMWRVEADVVAAIFRRLQTGPASVDALSAATGSSTPKIALAVARLAKFGFLALS